MRWHDTPVGRVPVISTELHFDDHLGSAKARWGIGRMTYRVPAGLYAFGSPGPEDPVLVTANYKMSFDQVRSHLGGRNLWLVVLETFGINVWCAAGKKTFSTDEVVARVEAVRLSEVVTHRRLVLPMLGAAGVAAHEVERRSGFRVRYAGIRAGDLPAYFDTGGKVTPEMQELTFPLWERLVLSPVELVQGFRKALPLMLIAFVAGGVDVAGTFALDWRAGLVPAGAVLSALLGGAVVVPVLLPWLPSRAFSIKGGLVGLVVAAIVVHLFGAGWGWPQWAACFLILPALTAFVALNYSGCTPYTAVSGVKLEMRLTLPVVTVALVAGMAAWIAGLVVGVL